MFALMTFMAMTVFALATNRTSRRRGAGITRRPYGNVYSDAAGARTDVAPRGEAYPQPRA